MLKFKQIILSKLPPTPPPHELDRNILIQLSLLIGVAVIAHFSIANIIIAGFAFVVYALKFSAIFYNKKSPPSYVMLLMLILSIAMAFFFYGLFNGKAASVSIVALLVTLKFVESKTLRDYYVVCILLYFLAASAFLFNSSIFTIICVVIYTIAITGILIKMSTPSQINVSFSLKESGKVILKALPLTIFLFFFFPRIQGDFGFLPSYEQSDTQGLKDSLVAGEMASSAFDNALAFRVQFEGEMPPSSQLYWRSKVMPIERDFQWEVLDVRNRNFVSGRRKQNALDLSNGSTKYDILHEPSQDKFIPYLDYLSGLNRGKILDDYSVFDEKPKNSIFTYKGSSTLTPSLPETTKLNEAQLLSTQSKPTARLQELIGKWRGQTTDQEELVRLVLQYFNQQQFSYTLTPPGLDETSRLDDFIFNSRAGYCEHYASAFTILMRWMGIPSRIVVGYQGGKVNKTGNYLEVRYSDAHAWSEVWIYDQWRRVDPTGVISPERIEFGMDALTELWDGNSFSNATGRALSDIINPTGAARHLQRLKDSWNNISYQWNKWVVNYNHEKQRDLLDSIGFKNKNSLTALVGFVIFGVLGFLLFYFWQLIPKPAKLDELQKAYFSFTKKFNKVGVHRLVSDTPDDFRKKSSQRCPIFKDEIDHIINTYQQLRYGPEASDNTKRLEAFKRQVKQFKLPRNS